MKQAVANILNPTKIANKNMRFPYPNTMIATDSTNMIEYPKYTDLFLPY